MRVSTQDGSEFRFWLTRRFVRALRPAFGKTLERQAAARTSPEPAARREVLNFERERAVSTSDFRTPYKGAATTLPLGETPVLLTRLKLTPREAGGVVLAVGPEQGAGVDLALNPMLMHSLAALLDTALAAAEWDLVEQPAPGDTGAAAPTSIN